ncbi:putative monooxygenase [Lentzea fradiae]|uniref:Putative monooxygenase n=1 Tax=Lentzea fradiae TaxID=200378 RepID=A0A1G7LCQ9_9PSEU|nr:cupin domain-containing protein [Lentzea fradiae]SDF47166.1 putative monooxygenase [Lentzea fradiae]
MTGQLHHVMSPDDVAPNTGRGGDIRVVLGPATVGATSGFMGVVLIAPGDRVNEHYHPYSEEFLYVVEGSVVVDLDDVPHEVGTDQAVLVPIGVRHRVRNTGTSPARVLFQLCPLAPRPDLGHVDTEQVS